jgi:hypothetical protein
MSRKVLLSTGLLASFLIFPKPAHAIIFLPALILIPIAKLVAVIIGGLSIPALSVSAIWSKLTKQSLKKTIVLVIVALIVLAIIVAVILKIENPSRPLF